MCLTSRGLPIPGLDQSSLVGKTQANLSLQIITENKMLSQLNNILHTYVRIQKKESIKIESYSYKENVHVK